MKKTRLFKHFITLIHCCALAIPLFTLIGTFIFNYLAPTAYFASHKNESQYEESLENISSLDSSLTYDTLYFDIKYLGAVTSTALGANDRFIYFEDLNIIVNDTGRTFSYPKGIAFYIGANANTYNCWILNGDDTLSGGFNSSSNFICTFTYLGNDLSNTLKTYMIDNNTFKKVITEDINDIGDLDDVKNYQPKTFDDACFYTMQSMGVLTETGDSMKDVLDNVYGQDVDYVSYIYEQDDDLSVFTTPTGVINYDWFEMFNVNGVIKDNQSSWLFFMNFYINYFINISIIMFMPIVIMGFLKFCTNLILKFIEKGEDY